MSVKTVRWGIISTGGISTKFSLGLLSDPADQDVSDVGHVITAIGSRSVESAQAFVGKLKGLKGFSEWGINNGKLDKAKAYGTYQEVFDDPNVDAVYIGTPHTYHYQNTKDALNLGKHVLCEKPFTFMLEELDELIAIAKKKKLFLMEITGLKVVPEGCMDSFHPVAYALQDLLFSRKLGKVKRFQADLLIDLSQPDRAIGLKAGYIAFSMLSLLCRVDRQIGN